METLTKAWFLFLVLLVAFLAGTTGGREVPVKDEAQNPQSFLGEGDRERGIYVIPDIFRLPRYSDQGGGYNYGDRAIYQKGDYGYGDRSGYGGGYGYGEGGGYGYGEGGGYGKGYYGYGDGAGYGKGHYGHRDRGDYGKGGDYGYGKGGDRGDYGKGGDYGYGKGGDYEYGGGYPHPCGGLGGLKHEAEHENIAKGHGVATKADP